MWRFDIFFVVSLNTLLNKQSICRRNVIVMHLYHSDDHVQVPYAYVRNH